MAKLASASIRLVQKLNRKTKNGENPIYLVVCFHGRLEKACGVSCLEKDWDGRREEIKKSCPNAAILNKILFGMKQKVIDKKLEYEMNGISYTPLMLLDDEEKVKKLSSSYRDVMEAVIEERRLKYKTIQRYNYSFKKLVEFIGRDDFNVDYIDLGFIKDFVAWLSVGDSAKRDICATINSVWNYAIRKKVVSDVCYPFREFVFTQKYKDKSRDYCIDLCNIKKLKEYFLDMVIERNGNRWSYRDGALNRLHDRKSCEFGLCYFLAMYHLNGSAPYDVAKLRLDDIERVVINGEDYFKIDFKRQKTHSSVSVRLKRNMFSIIMLEHFMGFSSNGYVYPIIKGGSDVQIQGQINKCGEKAIKWVREAFEAINKSTIESNVINGLEEPLVDVSKVVLYTARHSFASNYLNSEGATVRGAASLLGRSANTIAVYIHSLQNSQEIAEAVSFLDE